MPTFDNVNKERYSKFRNISSRGPEHGWHMSAYDKSRSLAAKTSSQIAENNGAKDPKRIKYRITFDPNTREIKKELVK